jgi:hypothetical protein
LQTKLVFVRPFELERGWIWCHAESGEPAAWIDEEDFRTLLGAGLIVKRPVEKAEGVTAGRLRWCAGGSKLAL